MKIVRYALICLLVLGGVVLALLDWNGQLRFLQPGSRLGAFETRIESVESEFIRRNPVLHQNFARFETCVRKADCDLKPIFDEREVLIQKAWPEMLDRLTVADDWGEATLSQISHKEFIKGIQAVGGKERARLCQPVIGYYYTARGYAARKTYTTYKGLRCAN